MGGSGEGSQLYYLSMQISAVAVALVVLLHLGQGEVYRSYALCWNAGGDALRRQKKHDAERLGRRCPRRAWERFISMQSSQFPIDSRTDRRMQQQRVLAFPPLARSQFLVGVHQEFCLQRNPLHRYLPRHLLSI